LAAPKLTVQNGPRKSERLMTSIEIISRDEGDTMNSDTQLLLSVEEAADVLGLGRTRAYELVMARKIQSVKVGRRRLVVRSSLLDFVQALLVEQDFA
jgi:excisionase family DNA binding protein